VKCNPKFDYIFLGHVTSDISGLTSFDFPTSIFNRFHDKTVSSQRNTHSLQIYTLYPQTSAFLEGSFYLCVKNVMSVLDPLFLHIKS